MIKNPAFAEPSGKKIFRNNCAACHGENAVGNEKLKELVNGDISKLDLTSTKTALKKDVDLENTILRGRGNMPSFKSIFPKKDLREVVQYIRHLQGDKLIKQTARCD